MKKILLLLLIFNINSIYATVYDFTDDNNLTLLKDARKAVELKLDLIRNAKHHIHLMSYYLDTTALPQRFYDELRKAHERGVEVRILTTKIPTLVKDPLGIVSKKLKVKDNGTVFKVLKLDAKGSATIFNNLHEKLLIADGEMAVIGGRNLSDAALEAKDMEVLISGGIVGQLQQHFLKVYDVLLDRDIKNICPLDNHACIIDRLQTSFDNNDKKYFPLTRIKGNIKGRLISHNAVLNQIENGFTVDQRYKMKDDILDTLISSDFKELRAYNYYILPTKRYVDFLNKSLLENKKINIITNSFKTAAIVSDKGYLFSLPKIHQLISAGAKIYQWQRSDEFQYLHEKVVILNDDHVFIGSHNFGTGSTTSSNEIAIEFYSKEIGSDLIHTFDTETQNEQFTKEATLGLIKKETDDNRKIIKILNETFAGTFIEESY